MVEVTALQRCRCYLDVSTYNVSQPQTFGSSHGHHIGRDLWWTHNLDAYMWKQTSFSSSSYGIVWNSWSVVTVITVGMVEVTALQRCRCYLDVSTYNVSQPQTFRRSHDNHIGRDLTPNAQFRFKNRCKKKRLLSCLWAQGLRKHTWQLHWQGLASSDYVIKINFDNKINVEILWSYQHYVVK